MYINMIYLIAAMTDNDIIDNEFHWDISHNSKWFRMNTTGGTVIMGRKTWESLPNKPLDNCVHIILTRGILPENSEHVYWKNSFDDAINSVWTRNTYIIGGSDIFHTSLLCRYVDSLLLTRVHTIVIGGNSLMLPDQKQMVFRSKEQKKRQISYHFEIYNIKK